VHTAPPFLADVYSWEADEAPLKQKEKTTHEPRADQLLSPPPALSAPPKGEVGGLAVEASFFALHAVIP